MKHFMMIAFALCFSTAVYAQVDLSKNPGQSQITNKSNAQLLRESSQPGNQQSFASDSNGLSEKYKLSPTSTTDVKNSSMFLNEDGQRNHTQQQQINLGNGGTKATNTIHYDNAGRVQGSGTSIQFGGKKK